MALACRSRRRRRCRIPPPLEVLKVRAPQKHATDDTLDMGQVMAGADEAVIHHQGSPPERPWMMARYSLTAEIASLCSTSGAR